jgi:hypothetical protein
LNPTGYLSTSSQGLVSSRPRNTASMHCMQQSTSTARVSSP